MKRKLLFPPPQLFLRHHHSPNLHEDAVCPDGLSIVVEWGEMAVGGSVFIPAVNHKVLSMQVKDIAGRLKMTLKGFSRIEAGCYGMRFWRVL